MDQRIPTRSTDLVELRLAAGATGEVVAAAGITDLRVKLVGVRGAADRGVHHQAPWAVVWA